MSAPYTPQERKELAKERNILVDPQDEWLLETFTWHVNSNQYAATRMALDETGKRTFVYLHHCIMGCPIWHLDEIDHINRNPSDNRRSNLRWTTHSQNLINNNQAVGQTGVRGTTRNSSGNYVAQVKRKGINHYLGSYATLDEAIAARDAFLHEVSNE